MFACLWTERRWEKCIPTSIKKNVTTTAAVVAKKEDEIVQKPNAEPEIDLFGRMHDLIKNMCSSCARSSRPNVYMYVYAVRVWYIKRYNCIEPVHMHASTCTDLMVPRLHSALNWFNWNWFYTTQSANLLCRHHWFSFALSLALSQSYAITF